ncbi:unnamed protein product [Discosporangium mesarthrocarpum]
MEVKDKGNQVFHISPDVRKGLISLYKGADDHLMHFTWKERPSGTAVEDMIILPEEAVFKKVNTGREEDRVYLMEIGSSNRFFYWMQSKSSEKDEENMRKVNELMASPPADTQPGSQGAASSGAGDMMEMLRSMGTGASAQASLHDVGGSGATPSAPGSSSGLAGQGINIQNLQSILQNLGFSAQDQVQTSSTESTEGPSTATEASTSTPAQQPPQEIPTPSATSGSDETSAPASGPEASAVASAAASASTGGGSGETTPGPGSIVGGGGDTDMLANNTTGADTGTEAGTGAGAGAGAGNKKEGASAGGGEGGEGSGGGDGGSNEGGGASPS